MTTVTRQTYLQLDLARTRRSYWKVDAYRQSMTPTSPVARRRAFLLPEPALELEDLVETTMMICLARADLATALVADLEDLHEDHQDATLEVEGIAVMVEMAAMGAMAQTAVEALEEAAALVEEAVAPLAAVAAAMDHNHLCMSRCNHHHLHDHLISTKQVEDPQATTKSSPARNNGESGIDPSWVPLSSTNVRTFLIPHSLLIRMIAML